jgi:hypothetical protein
LKRKEMQAISRRNPSTKPRASIWTPAHAAPFGRDLELAVIDGHDINAIEFPCRRERDGWTSADDRRPLDIEPTHWRHW